jgi:plastocyanin
VKWWKNLMRGTLVGYWLVGLLGVGTYYVWYTAPAGASGAPVAALDKNTVVVPVANYRFSPQTLTIPLGAKVIFVNQDPGPHTVTFDHGEFPAAGLDEGGQHEIVFDSAGTFQYYCEYHGSPGLRDMAGVITVVAAGQAAVPTAVAPPAPTPEPTAAVIAAAPLGPLGFSQFRDAAARNDAFDLTLHNLPAGSGDLNAWLTGANGSVRLGTLTPDVNGAAAIGYVDPQGANLIAQYSSFVVTRETAGAATASPSATVVVGGGIPDGALGPVRQLLVASDAAPKSQALAIGMLKQTEELYRHVTAVNNAALAGDFDSLNRHAEHLFTIVEGKGGPEYRDFNGDGFITDPGDGFGIVQYADAIEAQAKTAAAAPDAGDSVKLHAGHLIVLARNTREWGAQLVAVVIKAHQAAQAADQQAYTAQALALAQAMLNGVDANNNDIIEPIAGEGGAYTAYFHSQYLAAMGATMR